MRTLPQPRCYLCGSAGEILYAQLSDRLFGVPGAWDLRRCAASDCGLVWLDPAPIESDIALAYRDYYTHEAGLAAPPGLLRRGYDAVRLGYLALKHGYGGERVSWPHKLLGLFAYCHPGRRAVMDFSVMHLPATPGGDLLDVGCGSGAALRFMRELGWRVVGVDFDPHAVQAARASGLDVQQGSLEEQHFPDDRFDAVTLSHVIEHLHDPLNVLRECRRILRPGGRLALVTPNVASFAHRRYGRDWKCLEPPRHLHLFAPGTVAALVSRAGFTDFAVRTSVRDAYGVFLGSRALQRDGAWSMAGARAGRERLRARAFELAEWLALKLEPDAGEELVVLARK